MPRADDPMIETEQLGQLTSTCSPSCPGHYGLWAVSFDTGVVMFVPMAIFRAMNFTIAEKVDNDGT